MSQLQSSIDSHKIHSGWLWKKGWYNTSWKKRYFVLYDDRTVHYYAKEIHASSRSKAKGSIHLTQIKRVELVQYNDKNNKKAHSHPQSSPHRSAITPITHRSTMSFQLQNTNNSNAPCIDFSYDNEDMSLTPPEIRLGMKKRRAYTSDLHGMQDFELDNNKNRKSQPSTPTENNNLSPRLLSAIDESVCKDLPIREPLFTLSKSDPLEIVHSRGMISAHVNGWRMSKSHGNDEYSNQYQYPSVVISSATLPPSYEEQVQTHDQVMSDDQFAKSMSDLRNQRRFGRTQSATTTQNQRLATISSKRNKRQFANNNKHIKSHSNALSPYSFGEPNMLASKSVPSLHNATQTRTRARSHNNHYISKSHDIKPKKSSSEELEQSLVDMPSAEAECTLTDNEDYEEQFSLSMSTSCTNRDGDIVVSTPIKECHDKNTDMNDEFDVFQTIIRDTKLNLSCNKTYAFALISNNREWFLAAESNKECKEWASLFSKLSQGQPVYSGYLVKIGKKMKSWKKRFFILYENKVLNYYDGHNDINNGLIGDIDLRHVMWLRYCPKNEYPLNLTDYFKETNHHKNSKSNPPHLMHAQSGTFYLPGTYVGYHGNTRKSSSSMTNVLMGTNGGGSNNNRRTNINNNKTRNNKTKSVYSLEIATPNRVWIMSAPSQRIRNEWYNQIRNVFSDTLLLKHYYDSAVLNINIIHNGQNFKNRYIALFRGLLVIFTKKQQLDTIKTMTFFSDSIFRDYARTKGCTVIILNSAIKAKRASSKHGKYAFSITQDNRKWYFTVASAKVLNEWSKRLFKKKRASSTENIDPGKINVNADHIKGSQTISFSQFDQNFITKDTLKEPSHDVEVESSLSPRSAKTIIKNQITAGTSFAFGTDISNNTLSVTFTKCDNNANNSSSSIDNSILSQSFVENVTPSDESQTPPHVDSFAIYHPSLSISAYHVNKYHKQPSGADANDPKYLPKCTRSASDEVLDLHRYDPLKKHLKQSDESTLIDGHGQWKKKRSQSVAQIDYIPQKMESKTRKKGKRMQVAREFLSDL